MADYSGGSGLADVDKSGQLRPFALANAMGFCRTFSCRQTASRLTFLGSSVKLCAIGMMEMGAYQLQQGSSVLQNGQLG